MLNSTTCKTTYTIQDGVSSYPIGFEFIAPEHIAITIDGISGILGVDYTVSDGNVIIEESYTGKTLVISRTTPFTQESDYQVGRINPEQIEKDFDSTNMKMQELKRDSEGLYDKIDTVEAGIKEAKSSAEEAKNTARMAADTAGDALEEATDALSVAQTAASNANTAISTANSIKATADNANTKADAATTRADSAIATANVASGKADAASLSAETAQSIANSALSATQNINTTITVLNEQVQENTQSLSSKQDKLTAGENIIIENNVISSTGGGAAVRNGINWDNTITVTVPTQEEYNNGQAPRGPFDIALATPELEDGDYFFYFMATGLPDVQGTMSSTASFEKKHIINFTIKNGAYERGYASKVDGVSISGNQGGFDNIACALSVFEDSNKLNGKLVFATNPWDLSCEVLEYPNGLYGETIAAFRYTTIVNKNTLEEHKLTVQATKQTWDDWSLKLVELGLDPDYARWYSLNLQPLAGSLPQPSTLFLMSYGAQSFGAFDITFYGLEYGDLGSSGCELWFRTTDNNKDVLYFKIDYLTKTYTKKIIGSGVPAINDLVVKYNVNSLYEAYLCKQDYSEIVLTEELYAYNRQTEQLTNGVNMYTISHGTFNDEFMRDYTEVSDSSGGDTSELQAQITTIKTDVNELQTQISNKQDALVAGSNIKIEGNVISANVTTEGGDSAVTSVNGQNGDVILTAASVGALTKEEADNAYLPSTKSVSFGTVTSFGETLNFKANATGIGGLIYTKQDGTLSGQLLTTTNNTDPTNQVSYNTIDIAAMNTQGLASGFVARIDEGATEGTVELFAAKTLPITDSSNLVPTTKWVQNVVSDASEKTFGRVSDAFSETITAVEELNSDVEGLTQQVGNIDAKIPDTASSTNKLTTTSEVQSMTLQSINEANSYTENQIADLTTTIMVDFATKEELANVGGLSKEVADATYLPLTGGTMTGSLFFEPRTGDLFEIRPTTWGSLEFRARGLQVVDIDYNSGLLPNGIGQYSLGRTARVWKNVYTQNLNNGADIAVPTEGGTMARVEDIESKFQVVDALPDSPVEGVFYFIKEA